MTATDVAPTSVQGYLARAAEVAERVAAVVPGIEDAGARFDAEIGLLRNSGVLAAVVPARLGGPGIPPSAIAEAVRLLAAADGSFGQIPQSHFVFGRWIFNGLHPDQEEAWANRLLSGALIANAQAERGRPVLLSGVEDQLELTGTKYFCTGSTYADILAVTARRAGENSQTLGVFLDADTTGITVNDDWDALGQRLTGSGSVVLDRVRCHGSEIRSFEHALQLPGYGAFAQLLHAAIDVGIAGSALDESFARLRTGTQPGPPDEVAQALTHHLAGELQAQRFAAVAVLEKAGRSVDRLWEGSAPVGPADSGTAAEVALDVAAAKTVTGALTVDLASRSYELLGSRATTRDSGLDRYWRNLRTHTLHEKRREKLATLGRAWVTGQDPVLGPQL